MNSHGCHKLHRVASSFHPHLPPPSPSAALPSIPSRPPPLKLTKAYSYLGDVAEHKQVIPFGRFGGGVGVRCRRSNSRQLKVRSRAPSDIECALTFSVLLGCWPDKSARFNTRLLKNAESNAEAKSLSLEDLIIRNIVAQQAPKMRGRTLATSKAFLALRTRSMSVRQTRL